HIDATLSSYSGYPRYLHSFPTRRSSDLLIDFSQVVREAQIQHTVGFVNHQELNLVQLDLHGALQIQQTTRRCHDQVSVLQLGNRSEEHTLNSSHVKISYAVFCLKKKKYQ